MIVNTNGDGRRGIERMRRRLGDKGRGREGDAPSAWTEDGRRGTERMRRRLGDKGRGKEEDRGRLSVIGNRV
jgi:hypothetical protein